MTQDIGWDDHLERCWNEHTDAQDDYEREQRIKEIDDELIKLEFAIDEAEEDGRIQDVAALQVEIDNLIMEQTDLMLSDPDYEED